MFIKEWDICFFMNNDIKEWELENEEALVSLYFNCDSDLYEDYSPYDDIIHHTDEQMLEFQEGFDEVLPSGFVEDVYVTLNERCPTCLMRDCICN